MISTRDKQFLDALSEDGGFTTRQVACMTTGTGRRLSAEARLRLLSLKNRGFVRYLDEGKPVCWVRTKAGTAATLDMDW